MPDTGTSRESTGVARSTGEGRLTFGELEHSIGFVLRIAQLTAFDRFFNIIGESDLKISEFTVLLAVSENPGVRQGALADVLKIKWSNMTKLVRTLEQRGWITRRVPPHDRRAVELLLTPAGQAQIDEVGEHMYRSDHQALDMLNPQERRQLLALLHKVIGWDDVHEERKRAVNA